MLVVLLEPVNRADFKYLIIYLMIESEVKYRRYKRKHWRLCTYIQDVSKSIENDSRMVNFLSISMFLVLLKPVSLESRMSVSTRSFILTLFSIRHSH